MSPVFNLVVTVLVAAAAFAAGYFIGRFQALAERRSGRAWSTPEQSPLPGPEDSGGYGNGSRESSQPRGAPPPASAGSSGSGSGARRPPRRSTKPPPAIAGLMSRITGNKSGDGQK